MRKQMFGRIISSLALAAAIAGCGSMQTAEPTAAPVATVAPLPTTAPAATALPVATTMLAATTTSATMTAGEQNTPNLTLSDIANNPDAYLGQTVTIQGDVTQLIGPRSLALNDAALLGGDRVLVVGVPGSVVGMEGDTIQVTGTVRRFDVHAAEQEAGYTLNPDLFTDWNTKPVIIAQHVQSLSGDTASAVTFSQIHDNAAAWVGKRVTVRGNLADLLGQRSFTLREPGLGTDRFLIIAENDQVIPSEEPIFGQQGAGATEWVQVTGVIQMFDRAGIVQELGLDLPQDKFGAYEGQPVIIASTIHVIGDENAQRQQGGVLGTPVSATATTSGAAVLTVAQVVGNMAQYTGQQVTVQGDIDALIAASIFTLDESAPLSAGIDNDLLVVGSKANAFALDNGWLDDRVQVTGTVRQFVRVDIERDYSLTLDPQLVAEYEGKPVLIATSVEQLNH